MIVKKPFSLKKLLSKLIFLDNKTLEIISSDTRKISITAISISLVGLLISGDNIGFEESRIVGLIGGLLWVLSLIIEKTQRL